MFSSGVIQKQISNKTLCVNLNILLFDCLVEKIKEKTIDSEKIICSLRFRILQNEKELRNCLVKF